MSSESHGVDVETFVGHTLFDPDQAPFMLLYNNYIILFLPTLCNGRASLCYLRYLLLLIPI